MTDGAWRQDVTDGAWGGAQQMAHGVGGWRRWAKRAKAWSSLRSIWLMGEAEKLYATEVLGDDVDFTGGYSLET